MRKEPGVEGMLMTVGKGCTQFTPSELFLRAGLHIRQV